MEYTRRFERLGFLEIIEGGYNGSFYRACVNRIMEDDKYNVTCFCRGDCITLHISAMRPFPVAVEFNSGSDFDLNFLVEAQDPVNDSWHAGIITDLDLHPITVRLLDQTQLRCARIRAHTFWFPLTCFVFFRNNIRNMPNVYYQHNNQVLNPQEIDHQEVGRVEVNIGKYSFYPARQVEPFEVHNGCSRVVFEALFSDENSSIPVVADVLIANLRPSTPELTDRIFVENDLVDAYVNGNWHTGTLIGNAATTFMLNIAGLCYAVMLHPTRVVVHTHRIRFHAAWNPFPRHRFQNCLGDFPEVIVLQRLEGNWQQAPATEELA